jgi:type II secretory pathway pseudopilin PulG
MLTLPRHPLGHLRPFAKLRHAGFTLVEACASIVIVGLIAASVIWGLNQLNRYATASRLYTAAQTLAQNQIDIVLTKGPYTPLSDPPGFPSPNVLRTDVATYYSNPVDGSISTTTVPVTIYKDPMDNTVIVTGTIETSVTDPAVQVNGVDLNLRQATVNVKYTFRNRSYMVTMETIRAPDV